MIRVLGRLFLATAAASLVLPAVAFCSDGVGMIQGAPRHAPVAFTANRGQWPDNVLFRASSGDAALWITRDGILYQLTRRVEREDTSSHARWSAGFSGVSWSLGKPGPGTDSIEQMLVRATFIGANLRPHVVGLEELEYRCNYFLGNDPSRWRSDVPNYSAVLVEDIYPGIDIKYSRDEYGRVIYELATAPGADLDRVQVRYEGAEASAADAGGRPVARTDWGYTIDMIDSRTGRTGFVSPLRLLPSESAARSAQAAAPASPSAVELVYSTYLGSVLSFGFSLAVDADGNVYVTGKTSAFNLPTQNPYQGTIKGPEDVFVTKFSAGGNSLVYSTYLGGTANDGGNDIALDAGGSAYVTGWTTSTDFPVQNPYQTRQGDLWADAFVAKLSSSGNSLVYSTYLGGTDYDEGLGIALDASGNAYVTGETRSPDFPTQNPYQTYQGSYDAFVTKLSSSGSSLVYSTCLGGQNLDEGMGIAVNGSGNAYVTGATYSSNFPTQNPYKALKGPLDSDAFVTKLSSGGNSLVYSTYLGGADADAGNGIALDALGNAYVAGWTGSLDFPTLNPYQTPKGPPNSDAFVTKLSSSGNSLVYSTCLGGANADGVTAIALDASGNAYVTGGTYSSDFPTEGSYQTFRGGPDDAIAAKLSSSGNSLVYSTYLGGSSDDIGYGIALDAGRNAYVAGYTYSIDYPTQNPFHTVVSTPDVFVTKLRFPTSCPILVTGDVNTSGSITSADVITLVNYVFKSGLPPNPCVAAGDVNCNGSVTSADVISLVNFVFKGGTPPCDGCTSALASGC